MLVRVGGRIKCESVGECLRECEEDSVRESVSECEGKMRVCECTMIM